MRSRIAVLAVLAAALSAQEIPEDGSVVEEMLEAEPSEGSAAGRVSKGERDAPAVFVRLREGGLLEAKVVEEWKQTSLKGLYEVLARSIEEHDREMKEAGKSGYEEIGPTRMSRLFLSIDAEPTVPWQHVCWLMVAAAESKIGKLELTDGTRRLLYFLPVDAGCGPGAGEPRTEIRISVHIVGRNERPERWGDVEVLRPTEVRYKRRDWESAALGDVADEIRKTWAEVKDLKDATVAGEIKAGNKVPICRVLEVMEVFESVGLASLSLYGTTLPSDEARTAPRLPFPLKSY